MLNSEKIAGVLSALSRVSDSAPRHKARITLKIGDWLLDPALNTIEKDNETIHLEPKAMAVLEILVRSVGRPVTRQELLDQVWGDAIVSDDALTQVVIKLRKAFADDSRKPRYIQTIPKRGYRLLASVEWVPLTKEEKWHEKYRIPLYVLSLFTLVMLSAYLWTAGNHQGASNTQVSPEFRSASETMTISVLPFTTVGAGSEAQAFARGLTADLTTDLSKLSALRVIHAIGAEAGRIYSRYQVHGSTQKIGQRLRFNVNLIESESGRQLWTERYEGPLDEIFNMQQAVSEEIVRQLAVSVSDAEKRQLAKRYTRNLEAYESFLTAQTELLRRGRETNAKARDWYRRALDYDPGFARAYAGLGLSYAADFRNRWVEDGAAALRKAREMAMSAQQIDNSIPEVYWVLAYVNAQHRQHEVALQALTEAVELDPSYADAYALMGGIHTYTGEPDKTITLLRKAIALRPEAGYLYYLLLGRAYFFLGDFDQALINLDEAVERNSESLEAHLYRAASSRSSGDLEAAEWEIDEVTMLEPDFHLSDWLETYPMADQVQIGKLEQQLIPLGL